VLASWLFVQYLLTDEVQIPYSQTEGYSPVTLKAQRNESYIDYLSRGGEDNDLYYNVKIEATKLLIENTENTFVTPVFNGSTALRNAAGQLIEKVTKSARRKENFDEAYLDKLFSDIETLYHLDEITPSGTNSEAEPQIEKKGLPAGSVALLTSLLAAWICIGSYYAVEKMRARKNLRK
jgi:multiple sugar transport system substrate-binding protein